MAFGFNVTNTTTYLCSSHFKLEDIRRAPGGNRHFLVKGERPLLHCWNDFDSNKRRPPAYRPSPKRKYLSPIPDVNVDDDTNSFSNNAKPIEYNSELKRIMVFT